MRARDCTAELQNKRTLELKVRRQETVDEQSRARETELSCPPLQPCPISDHADTQSIVLAPRSDGHYLA